MPDAENPARAAGLSPILTLIPRAARLADKRCGVGNAYK